MDDLGEIVISMLRNIYVVVRILIYIYAFIGCTAPCISQENKELLIISEKVGPAINSEEKLYYNLFPAYSDDSFIKAQFYQNPDGTIDLYIYMIDNEKEVIRISYKEYKLIRKKINSSFYYAQIEKGYSLKEVPRKDYNTFTFEEYQMEKKHKTYVILNHKQARGDTLTEAEIEWLFQYNKYLDEYYENLPEEEKEKYQTSVQLEEKREDLGIPDNVLYIVEKTDYPIPEYKKVEGGEVTIDYKIYKNYVYLDVTVLGSNIYYERNIKVKNKSYLNWRLGYGLSAGIFDCNHQHLILNGVYLYGKGSHYLEFDFGLFFISCVDDKGPLKWRYDLACLPLVALGYKYQEPSGPVFFRFGAGFEPIACHIGIGFSF